MLNYPYQIAAVCSVNFAFIISKLLFRILLYSVESNCSFLKALSILLYSSSTF